MVFFVAGTFLLCKPDVMAVFLAPFAAPKWPQGSVNAAFNQLNVTVLLTSGDI